VKDALGEILEKIQSAPDGMPFENIFSGNRDRLYIITTFLALLELIKMQAVRVYQSANFGNIYIYPVSDDEQQETPVH
jgi:segregation and condensation protein A